MDTSRIWIWIDGEIRRAGEARIDVLDHGFLYGDSIYETLRTYDGKMFALPEHVVRLRRSAAAIHLPVTWSDDELSAILTDVVAARPAGSEAGLRLVITRGVGPLGLDTSTCTDPQLIVIAWPLATGPHPKAAEGIDTIISTVRRNPPGALNPHIKSGNFLNNILAYQQAKAAGAFEAILLTVEGAIAEGTTSNVFWVEGGVLRTAPDEGILLGVTRDKVLEILQDEGIPHEVGSYPAGSLQGAEEAFITSTLKGILPVATVDGQRLPAGVPGPLTRRIHAAYEARTRAEA